MTNRSRLKWTVDDYVEQYNDARQQKRTKFWATTIALYNAKVRGKRIWKEFLRQIDMTEEKADQWITLGFKSQKLENQRQQRKREQKRRAEYEQQQRQAEHKRRTEWFSRYPNRYYPEEERNGWYRIAKLAKKTKTGVPGEVAMARRELKKQLTKMNKSMDDMPGFLRRELRHYFTYDQIRQLLEE
jgi:hypothetical protein